MRAPPLYDRRHEGPSLDGVARNWNLMRTVECKTIDELRAFFDSVPAGSLYRGQTREYLRSDGGPDVRTSFDRLGCVPSRMIKWWHYSRTILASHVKAFDGFTDLATDQAILQHYGWRSFFLDATADPAVACWFAGKRYGAERGIELIEDCFERPVFVVREKAKYAPVESRSCIYVINRKVLRAHGLQAVDLVEITTVAGRPRFLVQSAFMVGHLTGQLPDDCILARAFADSATFRAYAAQKPDMTEERLFPGPESDPVLATLLSVPWVKQEGVGDKIKIDFFERGLPLPEYNAKAMRATMPSVAYYRRFWIANAADEASFLSKATFYLTAESLYHGVADDTLHFPLTTRLLREKRAVAVEINGLIRHPYNIGLHQYGKGIYLELDEDGIVLVAELSVEHPGGSPSGFGITRGRYFRIDEDGHWATIEHPDQCDCGRAELHAHHVVVAAHFEDVLARGKFREIRPRLLASADVDPTTDRIAQKSMDENEHAH